MIPTVKYDGYSYFRAGVRFLESLATWLKQFNPDDRAAAYEFLKRRLVYVSLQEMRCRKCNALWKGLFRRSSHQT